MREVPSEYASRVRDRGERPLEITFRDGSTLLQVLAVHPVQDRRRRSGELGSWSPGGNTSPVNYAPNISSILTVNELRARFGIRRIK